MGKYKHPELRDDEDTVDYLYRIGDYYRDNPPPPGKHLALIDCDAQPRHWPTYEVKTDDFYPAPCLYCVNESYQKRLDANNIRTHWLDHPVRGKWASKILGWAYSMGIIASFGTQFGGPTKCHYCISGVRFKGKRPYILGRPQWTREAV